MLNIIARADKVRIDRFFLNTLLTFNFNQLLPNVLLVDRILPWPLKEHIKVATLHFNSIS